MWMRNAPTSSNCRVRQEDRDVLTLSQGLAVDDNGRGNKIISTGVTVKKKKHINNCGSVSSRWVPTASASAGKVPVAGSQWGEGPYPWWWHYHHHTGELEEGGSWGDQEGGGDGYRHGRGGDGVTAVLVSVFCLQQHLLHYGGSQPGLDTSDLHFHPIFFKYFLI